MDPTPPLPPTDFSRPTHADVGTRWATIVYPPELPVTARKADILAEIVANQVVIIAGDTGSGKTTQLPKICLEAGRRRIACTQPRRVAAISLSRRVAEELGVPWGREVGCKIRFMDQTSPDTAVKFLTDGMLLAEVQSDPLLRAYDTVIIDEAHERSLNIDFLLGHLNQIRHRRRDLKILITSATIDTAAFARAFDQAPVISVSGRMFPVEILYRPVDEVLEAAGEFTHLDAVAATVERVLLESDQGDILVFLATERDIRETADLLTARKLGPLEILPLFGRLSASEQQRVFARSSHRKVVLGTNIAETSLTIPGIRFVIDTGEARVSRFNSRSRTRRLPIEPIAQSSAQQRAGRCGRVGPGVCIRLYAEEDFRDRPKFTPPEIQRANLADVILRLKSARLGDVETFPFLDPPPAAAIRAGYALLEELGALDAEHQLTELGRNLARLPVDPIVGRMLLQSLHEKSVREILVVASALSIQDPRERPAEAEGAADAAHRRFVHPDSDFLTLLAIWDAFHDEVERLSQGRLRKFCRQHFLNYARMREWRDIHAQLAEAMRDLARDARRTHAHSAPSESSTASPPDAADARFGGVRYRAIHRALLPGLLANVARREEGNVFHAGGDRRAIVFPGSALFNRKARTGPREKGAGRKSGAERSSDWIVAAEIVETTRLYARTCARIDVSWLLELGAHICVVSHSEPTFTVASGRVLVRETTRLHGLEIQTRRVGYGTINPAHATEIFIREGLLNDDLQVPHAFLAANRALRDKVEVLRTRLRAGHYLDLDEGLYRFYASHLAGVSSIHDLNRVVREHIAQEPGFLHLREEDLLGDLPEDFDRTAFPDQVVLENSALPLHYAYKPGKEEDGVTLRLSPAAAKSLQPGMLDWLVPGHLEEKITHLLRSLPKNLRRDLLPIPEKAATIARELRPTHATLVESLAAHLEKHLGVRTFPGDWHPEEVPGHLLLRVEIVGANDQAIAASRDLTELRQQLHARERAAVQKPDRDLAAAWRTLAEKWERTGIDTLSFDPPPESLAVAEANGLPVRAFPGFRLEREGVALRLFRSAEEARIDRAAAVRRFFAHELRYELGWLDRDLKDVARLGTDIVTLAPLEAFRNHVRTHLHEHLCGRPVEPLSRESFAAAVTAARNECKGLLWRLLDQLAAILKLRNELLANPPLFAGFAPEIARLIPPDFPASTRPERLRHLPRYLKALSIRGRKARENPTRDAERSAMIAALEKRVVAREKSAPFTAAEREELREMFDELRVSTFAQELGTAFPISEKRIASRLAELGG